MKITELSHQSQCVTFSLAENLIGIDILDIREIVPCRRITRVAQAPEFVMGLMNLRGQILTVLDIGVLLGVGHRQIRPESYIIIFKHKDIGFVVDKIGDVVGMEKEAIEEIPANIQEGVQGYMKYVINLPNEILMLLDAEKILSKTMKNISGAKEPS